MTTHFTFAGDWGLWPTAIVAVLLSALAWWIYWRETRKRKDWLRWALPTLRALAVFWVFMILSGPVLRHREIIGELAQVVVLADTSQSMGLKDEGMADSRKLLLAQKFGFAPQGTLDLRLSEIAEQLRQAAQDAANNPKSRTAKEISVVTKELATQIHEAAEDLKKLPSEVWLNTGAPTEAFKKELLDPVDKLTSIKVGRNNSQLFTLLDQVIKSANSWSRRLNEQFRNYVSSKSSGSTESLQSSLAQIDDLSRWQRLEMHLLDGNESLIHKLGEEHQLQFGVINGTTANIVWSPSLTLPGEENPFPQGLSNLLTNNFTDLQTGTAEIVEGLPTEQQSALVVLSDGQHNLGETPLKLARVLGARGIPIHTVGFGSTRKPKDLAVLSVDTPDTVFYQSEIKGNVVIKDDMPIGDDFKVTISHNGESVWEKTLQTQGGSQQKIDFSFPVIDILRDELSSVDKDLQKNAVPVHLELAIEPLAGETTTINNTIPIRFSGITRKPRILYLEGRPRWEFRYLKTVFERDDSWAVNTLLAGQGGTMEPWQRGEGPGTFPKDRETLFSYQLIIIGDVPTQMLQSKEQEWIRQFVEENGGGLIFLDGHQFQSSAFSGTPMRTLLPVEWKTTALTGSNLKFDLQSSPLAQKHLSLRSQKHLNTQLWNLLPTPRRVSSATALPGSEALLRVSKGALHADAVVFRRQGSGRVLYVGFDESWRWRYGLGDFYHQRYWNQIAKWIMEPAYQVEDKIAALDSGPVNQNPGDTASIRARIRDNSGRLLLDAKADALLLRNGVPSATIRLERDNNTGGTFRGETGKLVEGDYEVRLRVEGIPDKDLKVSTTFTVARDGADELTHLSSNEELLKQVAQLSGGSYFPEENLNQLAELLRPLSTGKIVESEDHLWQTWWWFIPFIFLVTLEWILRKRGGLL